MSVKTCPASPFKFSKRLPCSDWLPLLGVTVTVTGPDWELLAVHVTVLSPEPQLLKVVELELVRLNVELAVVPLFDAGLVLPEKTVTCVSSVNPEVWEGDPPDAVPVTVIGHAPPGRLVPPLRIKVVPAEP